MRAIVPKSAGVPLVVPINRAAKTRVAIFGHARLQYDRRFCAARMQAVRAGAVVAAAGNESRRRLSTIA
jgi:hypothetical protein